MSHSPFTGAFTGAGAAAPVAGQHFRPRGHFNLSLWGAFVATVRLERSFDDGATWLPCTSGGAPVAFGAPVSEVCREPEAEVLYRLNCTAWTSGTVNWRLSQ